MFLNIVLSALAFAPNGAVRLPSPRLASSPRMGMFDFLAFGKAGASHILVESRSKATFIKQQIEDGDISFTAAAKQYSTCPSASKGGDLGTFGPGQMVGAFNDYCFDPDTKVNALGVVGTSFGGHVIKLTKKP